MTRHHVELDPAPWRAFLGGKIEPQRDEIVAAEHGADPRRRIADADHAGVEAKLHCLGQFCGLRQGMGDRPGWLHRPAVRRSGRRARRGTRRCRRCRRRARAQACPAKALRAAEIGEARPDPIATLPIPKRVADQAGADREGGVAWGEGHGADPGNATGSE